VDIGHVRNGYCDELLGYLGQSAVGEDSLAKALEWTPRASSLRRWAWWRGARTRSSVSPYLRLGGCGPLVTGRRF